MKGVGNSKKIHTPVNPAAIQDLDKMNPEQLKMFKSLATTYDQLSTLISSQLQVSFERNTLYRELSSALVEPIMAAGMSLYADVASTASQATGQTVWIDSVDPKVKNELELFLDTIGIEDRVYDWISTMCLYGDLFVEPIGEPGIGVVALDDSKHPSEMGRVDFMGKLVGFYKTPYALLAGNTQINTPSIEETKLLPPWQVVHFRLVGANKRRMMSDFQYGVFSSAYFISRPTTEGYAQFQSKYGSSVLFDGLVPYKRLKLSKDCLMLARLSRSLLKYAYIIGMDANGSNPEQTASIVDTYKQILKRARTMSTDNTNPQFKDQFTPMSITDDIIIPVFGDVNQFKVEKLGGDVDIKWIADIEELRNDLSTALKIPLPLLGGWTGETPSSLGRTTLEAIDIRFARQVRRIQRSFIVGMTRLCQIHLAYMGMSPDPKLFEVKMNLTSTAEEAEVQEALDKGSDTAEKVMNMFANALGEENLDKKGILNYLNKKLLKLEDLNIEDFIKNPDEQKIKAKKEKKKAPMGGGPGLGEELPAEEPAEEAIPTEGPTTPEIGVEEEPAVQDSRMQPFLRGTDVTAHLPIDRTQALNESGNPEGKYKEGNSVWESQYGSTKVKVQIDPAKV